ncbi:histone-lysine N-methyltransferase ASHH1 isoform X1 [Cynara cardunculus var. scolymus]|uniref:histone-lysine N-methyltransferase ASHH1 isoform X1 n=1 Tax=Cynara cardunculus var. scolymus TaxID=59895 RepID=UPI000D62D587|nr:histone-lysine N-methyltransferase ASHH1 isoform X1 [Cynara cardunculus var. scolymus]
MEKREKADRQAQRPYFGKRADHNLVRRRKVQLPEGVAPFTHITRNERSGRKQIKQKEEDIVVCECKFDFSKADLACGDRCLNVLTSTECTPGYCPCGSYCKNQRFQKSEYAKTKLFKTEGRGWGLLADQNIKAGQFIIEYCGEVISSDEAKERSQTYEAQGLRDAYIISLNASYFIDATKKGSLARFINHSCQPNCETRKWTVLGETRVGIFATQDISIGTELAYDYNFEWYGGVNVRCLCGAPNCSIFLGAKSQGFQEHNHVWEDGDDRYTVDEFPLYDSAEDEPSDKLNKVTDSAIQETSITVKTEYAGLNNDSFGYKYKTCFSGMVGGGAVGNFKCEADGEKEGGQHPVVASGLRSNNAFGDFNNGSGTGSTKRPAKRSPNRKQKLSSRKQINGKRVAQLFASKKVQDELIKCEEVRSEATAKLDSVYDEIRPAIEERERDSLDSLPTSVAEKWIEASCSKLRADLDLYFTVVKNVVCPPPITTEPNPSGPGDTENAVDCTKN